MMVDTSWKKTFLMSCHKRSIFTCSILASCKPLIRASCHWREAGCARGFLANASSSKLHVQGLLGNVFVVVALSH